MPFSSRFHHDVNCLDGTHLGKPSFEILGAILLESPVREYIEHFPGFPRVDTGKASELVAEESRSNEIQAHCEQTGHPYRPDGRIFNSDHSANTLDGTDRIGCKQTQTTRPTRFVAEQQ